MIITYSIWSILRSLMSLFTHLALTRVLGGCARLWNTSYLVSLRNTAELRSPALTRRRGEASMKRILVLLTVVALMIVMLAMAVAPAFAQGEQRFELCLTNPHVNTHAPFCQH